MELIAPECLRVQINGQRHYQVGKDMTFYPSVTTILGMINKPFLTPWRERITLDSLRVSLGPHLGPEGFPLRPPELTSYLKRAASAADQLRDQAAQFGTDSHTLIERLLLKGKLKGAISPEQKIVMDGFQQWQRQSGLTLKWLEFPVVSARWGYAGTVDAVGWRGDGEFDPESDELVILDWKTSNRLSWEYALQLAAYGQALEEMFQFKVAERWVVRLDKRRPGYQAALVSDPAIAWNAFRAALYLWRAERQSFYLED